MSSIYQRDNKNKQRPKPICSRLPSHYYFMYVRQRCRTIVKSATLTTQHGGEFCDFFRRFGGEDRPLFSFLTTFSVIHTLLLFTAVCSYNYLSIRSFPTIQFYLPQLETTFINTSHHSYSFLRSLLVQSDK